MTRFSIVILQTLLLLCLGEAGARLVERAHQPESDVTFNYAPYRMLRMVSAPWPLNREGFRARELETYRDTFLVEFLGASVCLGVGTNPGMILPDRLERLLHEAGMSEASVLNLCQGGATSAQELAIFLEYGLPLSPQVVLSFNGANDLMHPRPVGEDDAANLPYRNREIASRFDGRHSFADHLALIRVFGRAATRLLPERIVRASSPAVSPSTVLNSYLYATDVVRTLTEAQGGWYAVLLQPTLQYEKPWSDEERRMWKERRPTDGATISTYVSELYGAASTALGKWSQETSAGLFDLSSAFANTKETVYSDSVHFIGERGYETLERELVRRGLVEKDCRALPALEEVPSCAGGEVAALAQRIGLNAEGYRLARAMAATGSASILGGLLRVVSTKIVAAMLGPAGVAILSTLQQTAQTAVTATTMNGQTSLVRGISARLREVDQRCCREFARTVLVLLAGATMFVAATMLVAAGPVAQSVGLGHQRAPLIRLLAATVALSGMYTFALSLVNAAGAVQRRALLQITAPAALALLAYPSCRFIQVGADTWFVLLLTLASAVSFAAALWALYEYRSTLKSWFIGPGRWWTKQASREFLAVASSMALTGLLGSAAVLIVRNRILGADGLEITGHFDAAWSISMNQANLVLASMQSHYLPAMARANSAAERSVQLTQALRLGSIVGGAVIIVAAATKPALLGTLYSSAFEAGARYLRWTLLGDYLKVASWILSMPILAAADMKLFLASDLCAYGAFLLAAAVLGNWTSWAEGTAIAFVFMYAIHLVFCAIASRRRFGVSLDLTTVVTWVGGLLGVCGASAIFWRAA